MPVDEPIICVFWSEEIHLSQDTKQPWVNETSLSLIAPLCRLTSLLQILPFPSSVFPAFILASLPKETDITRCFHVWPNLMSYSCKREDVGNAKEIHCPHIGARNWRLLNEKTPPITFACTYTSFAISVTGRCSRPRLIRILFFAADSFEQCSFSNQTGLLCCGKRVWSCVPVV